MSEKLITNLDDFSLGLNVKDAANVIPFNALTEAQNAVITKGAISKRHGYERYVSATVERGATWQDVGWKKWSDF
ncbi:hypothetical protein J6TS2_50920 [Heyndrickxia sporothermodurans]|nr:hypothetical protein J6TS2_50920 [Heyndrickxia sporothermodurans]